MSIPPPGLVARIRQMRRAAAASSDAPASPGPKRTRDATPGQPPAELEARIAHLEQLVQGLQDSVYREFQRQDGHIAEIEKRLDPAALAAALSQDARERGL